MIPNLGQLQRINLREAWKNEATDFTPWLAQSENLNQLTDALGLSDTVHIDRLLSYGFRKRQTASLDR